MKKGTSPKVIDLFAGCGGLSLGLENVGFEPIFVNELHPVAMQTYLMNRTHLSLHKSMNHSYDIIDLTSNEDTLNSFARRVRRDHGDVELVAGGPPCQGYSGIGHRRSFKIDKVEIPSNHLYRNMARLIQAVAPRIFLFENVKGLLTSRWVPDGEKGEIWDDVLETFRRIETKNGRKRLGYSLQHRLVQAKEFGVPQNRPRIILVGVRDDVLKTTMTSNASFIPSKTSTAPDLVDLLGDLVDPDWQPGGTTSRYPTSARTSSQRQFRKSRDGVIATKGSQLTEHEYSNHNPQIIGKFEYMIRHGGAIPESMKTKKFAQRVLPQRWGPNGPTITATSLPDDYVHFSQPRVPTVREWARLQTFPDWYQFSGRRTTGGRRRAGDPSQGLWSRDLPKYTQIGNAVPVLLAEALGRNLRELFDL